MRQGGGAAGPGAGAASSSSSSWSDASVRSAADPVALSRPLWTRATRSPTAAPARHRAGFCSALGCWPCRVLRLPLRTGLRRARRASRCPWAPGLAWVSAGRRPREPEAPTRGRAAGARTPGPGGSSRQRLLGQRAGPGPPEKQSQRGGRMHRLSRSSAMTTGSRVMQADKSQGRQLASQGPGKSQGLGSRPEAGVTVAPAARKSGQRARHLGLFRPSTDRTRPTHIGGQGALSVYPFQC